MAEKAGWVMEVFLTARIKAFVFSGWKFVAQIV
jgi:hypothetical protein